MNVEAVVRRMDDVIEHVNHVHDGLATVRRRIAQELAPLDDVRDLQSRLTDVGSRLEKVAEILMVHMEEQRKQADDLVEVGVGGTEGDEEEDGMAEQDMAASSLSGITVHQAIMGHYSSRELGLRQRELRAIRMHYRAGMMFDEIAKKTGVTTSTVRQRYNKGMEYLERTFSHQ